jgi:hypothetical protein
VGFPDSCSTAALSEARKRKEVHTNTIFQSPTLSHHAHSPLALPLRQLPLSPPPSFPMAAPGPPQSMSHSSSASAPQQPPMPTHSDQITWDGDKMFNIYILDYCKKRGYRKTANELVIEADISPDSKPPINAQQGLLFEFVPLYSFCRPV